MSEAYPIARRSSMSIQRTIAISVDATFNELYQVTLAEWQAMPVIRQGQFSNLVFDGVRFRVWISRMKQTDYTCDEHYLEDRVVIEKLDDGRWVLLDLYGRPR